VRAYHGAPRTSRVGENKTRLVHGRCGGIEAESVMLGQPVSMVLPPVLGFDLTGALPPGVTATDLVLTVVAMLRKHGVVT